MWRRRNRGLADYAEAPNTGLCKLIPETRMPPGDGDEHRQKLAAEAAAAGAYIQQCRAAETLEEKVNVMRQSLAAENELRQKFAQDPENAALSDPYVSLIPVHHCEDIFSCRELSAEEQAIPRAFALAERRSGPAVVSRTAFLENHAIFTEGLLRNLNWDNVFAAGGSVLAALLPLPEKSSGTRQLKRQYYHHEAYTMSDIDLFLYGLNEVQANEKMKEIYFTICDAFPIPSMQPVCFRTQHAITIVSKFPYRHVQVVLRLYRSPAEVLAGFDVDSCSVGFDGSNVWMTPRCHNSVTAQYNTVDMTRRSPTYEVRLAKYSARGFEVAIPELDRGRLDPQIYETPFEKARGLMKLLLLERLQTPEQRRQYKQQQRVGRLQPLVIRQGRFYNRLQQDMNDAFIQAQVDEIPGDVSDYQTVFLPWGPNWDADKVRNLMYTKDMLMNSTFIDPLHKGYRHLCFFGTAAEVLEDCSTAEAFEHCGPVNESIENAEDNGKYIRGPVKWLTVDPGRQSIGSFHPITTGDWLVGVHLSVGTERLVKIAQNLSLSDAEAAAALAAISPKIQSDDVNSKDAAGRTPLMLAALTGNAAAAKAFVAAGALLNTRLDGGRSALHLAAQYGKADVAAVLLERGRTLNVALGDYLSKKEEEERAVAKQQLEEDEHLKDLREQDGSGAYYRALHVLKRKRAQEAARRSVALEEKGYLDKLDVNGEDYDQKMTPLMYAAFFGHIDVVKALLDEKADVSKMLTYEQNGQASAKHSLLTLACHNGHGKVFRMLLDARAPPTQIDLAKRTPLHFAALWGEIDCVRACLELSDAPDRVSPDAVDTSQKTALLLAIEEGHVETAELLLDHTGRGGALSTKNDQVQPPVAVAVSSRQCDVLAMLLRRGADPNILSNAVAQRNQFGGFGGGLFGPNGLFGHPGFAKHQNESKSTVLDAVKQSLESLSQNSASIPEQAQPQPSVSELDFFDFLLSKTSGHFERFALLELRRRAEEAIEGDSQTSQQSPQSTSSAGNNAEELQKLRRMLQILEEHGAKSAKDLLEEDTQESAFRRGKQAKKKKKPWCGIAHGMGGAPSQSQGGVAFQLGVASKPDPHQPRPGWGLFGAAKPAPSTPPLIYVEKFEAVHVPESSEALSLDSKVQQQEMQARYKALFDAVVDNNCAEVRALCKPPGASSGDASDTEPLLVAVKSSMLQMTPLSLAMLINSAEMVRCLLQIAVEQCTPSMLAENEAEDIDEGEEVKLKDSHLVQMGAQDLSFPELAEARQSELQELQASQTCKKKGHKMLERLKQYKAEEREGDESNLPLSACPLTGFVSPSVLPGPLQLGVQRRCYAAVEALLTELKVLDILVSPEEQATATAIAAPPGEPLELSSLLLRKRSCYAGPRFRTLGQNRSLTVFEAAIACDDVQMAQMLLSQGAPDCLRSDDGQVLPMLYTGLKVAGEKREDLALPEKLVLSRAQLRRDRLQALRVAAASGALESIEFLLQGGLDEFAMVGETEEDEKLVLSSLFEVGDRDSQGQTAMHFAVQHNQVSALRQLLSAGQRQLSAEGLESLLNIPCEGQKPLLLLHFAVSLGRLECVQTLLEYNALVSAAPDAAQRTALHIAVSMAEGKDKLDETKTAVIKMLLDASLKKNCIFDVLASADATGSTVLHAAARLQSQIALEAFLDSLKHLSKEEKVTALESKDQKGDTALHISATHKGTGRLQQIKALLAAGADTTALNSSSSTPLHLAAKTEAPAEILKLLLPLAEDKMRVAAEDATGHTPLEWLMASKLCTLSRSNPQSWGSSKVSENAEALELLKGAESSGRLIIDPRQVREHAARATDSATATSPPEVSSGRFGAPSGLFGSPSMGASGLFGAHL